MRTPLLLAVLLGLHAVAADTITKGKLLGGPVRLPGHWAARLTSRLPTAAAAAHAGGP